jgi:hypothetical protein
MELKTEINVSNGDRKPFQKTGRNLKSRMSRGNFKMVAILALIVGVLAFDACKKPEKDKNDTDDNTTVNPGTGSGTTTGLYMGIIGFNDKLTKKNIGLLNSSTKSTFTDFVNSMTSQNGTVLYYAVDNAISVLEAANLPADLSNVAIVTFTDGLDQGSHELNPNYQGNNAAYLAAVNSRIHSVKIKGNPISAYSIGIKGNDVTDEAQFLVNLQNLASAPANATKVTSMTEVNAKFQEIAASLYSESSTQSINLKIPGQADRTKIRFTFDKVSNAANSTIYIEGTYSFSDKSLQNVVYSGCSSTSGSMVSGTADGIFVSYIFADIKLTSGQALPTTNINQWSYVSSTSQWQINSEFTPEGNTQTHVERKSAVIMLVLDCSSSLGSQFKTMQDNANAFILTMASSGDVGGGGGTSGSIAITTSAVTSITSTTATLRGTISGNTSNLSYSGFYYSTSPNPTAGSANNPAFDYSKTLSYSSQISGLSANTKYYVRAFVSENGALTYGNEVSFTTTTNTTQKNAQVRFKKEQAFTYAEYLGIVNLAGDSVIAIHNFGTAAGTSPYYEIPAGSYLMGFYLTYPGQENWYSTTSSYNFVGGRKYTVTLDNDGTNWDMEQSDDGTFSIQGVASKDQKTMMKMSKSIKEAPKGSATAVTAIKK